MKLKNIATINAGYPFRGKIDEVSGSSIVAVQMKNVSLAEGICWADCVETDLTSKRKPDYLAPGDILVAARGNHNYAVQVDKGLDELGKQAVAAPHFFVLRLNKEYLSADFMVWLLNQAPVQRYFEQNAEGTFTKSIRRSVLDETPLVIPPLEKQQTITAMAATMRKEKRLLQQLINNGERLMRAIADDLHQSYGNQISKNQK